MKEAVLDFFTRPASPRPFIALRRLLSAILIVQALLIARDVVEFYGSDGFIQGALNDYFIGAAVAGLPKVSWLSAPLGRLGVPEATVVRGIFLLYLSGLGCLLVGRLGRAAVVVTWLTHSMLLNTGYFFSYGAVRFAEIALFYLLFMPLEDGPPSARARLCLRCLQIHLCIAYLATGIAKAQGAQWWNGEAIWRAVMLPHFNQFAMGWLARFPQAAVLAGWGTLVVEIGYPLLIWPARTRRAWGGLVLALHFGIAVCLGLVTFSATMMALTYCAFLEPSRLAAGAASLGSGRAPEGVYAARFADSCAS